MILGEKGGEREDIEGGKRVVAVGGMVKLNMMFLLLEILVSTSKSSVRKFRKKIDKDKI